MPFLIVSDIHANREALDAVLDEARGRYDLIVCLGDLAGYGADPNYVVEWARANVAAIVRGNHDKLCAGLESFYSYRPQARAAAEWTMNALTPDNRSYLENLPRGPLRYEGFDLVHGSPVDEDEYLVKPAEAAAIRDQIETQLSFFGHTHLQGGFLIARHGVKPIDTHRVLEIEPDYLYLVNPGSVGQPRDGDPHAAYAIYSPGRRIVEFQRAAYDVTRAAEKIRAAGLPDPLAARLSSGV